MRGGYKLIDLKNTNLIVGGGSVTIKGIHTAIESNYRKALLFTGIEIGGVEMADTYSVVTPSGSNLVATIYGKILTITPDDGVTLTNAN